MENSKPRACFEVEKIIGISTNGNVRTYQVQWAPVWVDGFHLVGCENLIQEFLQQQTGESDNIYNKETGNEQRANGEHSNRHRNDEHQTNEDPADGHGIYEQGTKVAREVSSGQKEKSNASSIEGSKNILDETYCEDGLQPESPAAMNFFDVGNDYQKGIHMGGENRIQSLANTHSKNIDIKLEEDESCISEEANYRELNILPYCSNKNEDGISKATDIEYHSHRASFQGQLTPAAISESLNNTNHETISIHLTSTTLDSRTDDIMEDEFQYERSEFDGYYQAEDYSIPSKRVVVDLKGNNDKSYVCDICGRSLRSLRNLQRHKRIHTGDKPHECKICGQKFMFDLQLIRHKKKIHAVS